MDAQSDVSRWIDSANRRGQIPFLLALLDVIEPIAPVLAGGLHAAQPLARHWRGAAGLRELADLLEEPDGLRILRRRLAESAPE